MSAAHQHYRAPRECPVCSERLRVTQLGCDACGTGLSGDFESCDFCALDAGDLDVLRVFLTSRGNIKELERHLGVSYPTARARYDDVVRKLGLTARPGADPEPDLGPDADAIRAHGTPANGSDLGTSGTANGGTDPRLAALRALADGEVDVEQARRLITGA